MPALLIPRPMIPIRIAVPIAMTTHTLAILRDSFSFFSSLIAINRRRICGIPKYPSPHASVETIVRAEYGPEVPGAQKLWASGI